VTAPVPEVLSFSDTITPQDMHSLSSLSAVPATTTAAFSAPFNSPSQSDNLSFFDDDLYQTSTPSTAPSSFILTPDMPLLDLVENGSLDKQLELDRFDMSLYTTADDDTMELTASLTKDQAYAAGEDFTLFD